MLLAELPDVTTVEGNYSSALPALTATGDRAAIARGHTVEVYALPSGQLLRTIAHPAAVNAVAFAPAGHDLVSGAVDGSLRITHDEGDPIALPTAPAGIDAAAILADGRVVVADASARLRVIGPDHNALLMNLAAPSRVRLLRPSPDGARVITISTTSEQAPPVLWDLARYRLAAQLDGHAGRVFTAPLRGWRTRGPAARSGPARSGLATRSELATRSRPATRSGPAACSDPAARSGPAAVVSRSWPNLMKTASTPPLSELEASFDRIDRQRGSLSEWIELARAVVRAQVDAQTSLIAQQGFLIKDQLSQGRMQALLAEIDARTRTVERLYTLYRAIGRKITGS